MKPAHLLPNLILILVFTVVGTFGLSRAYPGPAHIQTKAPSTNLQRIETTSAIFTTVANIEPGRTKVVVPYKYETAPQSIWLSLSAAAGESTIVRLVSHPQLLDLNWPTIQDEVVTLYQRLSNYDTIADFIAGPPPAEQIIMDPYLSKLSKYRHLTTNTIEETSNLETFNYIFTTYKQPSIEDGLYYYESFIDASIAGLNEENNLLWLITAPGAGPENPFYLGTIHVQYRQ